MSTNSSHHRRSVRLPEYDYSRPGAYFVTLVTYQREPLFGEVTNGNVCLTAAGEAVREIWETLPGRYPQIELDEAVVMPNHFHGILWINESVGAIHQSVRAIHQSVGAIHQSVGAIHQSVGAIHELPLPPGERRSHRRKMLIPLVIGYFKMNSAKRINQILGSQGVPVWQRNYYEHIVRDERELSRIRQYICNNPLQWETDQENPFHYQE